MYRAVDLSSRSQNIGIIWSRKKLFRGESDKQPGTKLQKSELRASFKLLKIFFSYYGARMYSNMFADFWCPGLEPKIPLYFVLNQRHPPPPSFCYSEDCVPCRSTLIVIIILIWLFTMKTTFAFPCKNNYSLDCCLAVECVLNDLYLLQLFNAYPEGPVENV